MKIIIFLSFLFLAAFPRHGFAETTHDTAKCKMRIRSCSVEKKTYKKEWKSLYKRELALKEPCVFDGATALQLEPELGLRLDSLKEDGQEKLVVDLYSYKASFVIASSKVPLETEHINFSHRLKPKGDEFVEVTCKP